MPLSLLLDWPRRVVLLYFDASTPYQLAESEVALYRTMIAIDNRLIQVPSGESADAAMLRQARATGACIISRDRFRDWRRQYRGIVGHPARLLSGGVESDRVRIAGLDDSVPLLSLEACQRSLLSWPTS